jgi:bifunctional non-homologous end joining protein LigD
MVGTALEIPQYAETYEVKCGQKKLTLTNLQKIFWPRLHKTKRDLLIYYAAVSDVLLPHLRNRAFVIKKYPSGVEGKFVLMPKIPAYSPAWLQVCPVMRSSGNIIELPMVQDLASLLWIVNLGCVDFCQGPVRCDDAQRPDYVHFNLDPISPAEFPQAREAALLIHDFFQQKNINAYAKTTGSRGIHIYIPLYRKPCQREVWRVAKQIANTIAKRHPALLTSEHVIEKRLPGRVFIGYNQNAGGQTFSSPYSLCPSAEATASTPVTWEEINAGVSASEFTINSLPCRVAKIGDLFRPLVRPGTRYSLEALLSS